MHTACASVMGPSLRSVSGLVLLGLLVCLAPAVQGESSFWPRFRALLSGRRGGSRATGATNIRVPASAAGASTQRPHAFPICMIVHGTAIGWPDGPPAGVAPWLTWRPPPAPCPLRRPPPELPAQGGEEGREPAQREFSAYCGTHRWLQRGAPQHLCGACGWVRRRRRQLLHCCEPV